MAHLVKLIQARTLHLQRMVNLNPYQSSTGTTADEFKHLIQRLDALEARASDPDEARPSDLALSNKQTSLITTEVRKTLQPDLDALNRAVRRYEKRSTIQSFQTESRLQDLESRLNDAISLAAAAANYGHRQRGLTGVLVEWAVFPLTAMRALARLPFRVLNAILGMTKAKGSTQRPVSDGRRGIPSRTPSHGRVGDRLSGRVGKK